MKNAVADMCLWQKTTTTCLMPCPKASHLVMCYPGGQSKRYNINPNHAALLAASRVAEFAMCDALRKASEVRPSRTPLTPEQHGSLESFD
jgi:hypothetical protein